MQPLKIQNTIRTAGVDFDPVKGSLLVHGNSIPENSDGFFQPLHDWIEEFRKEYNGPVRFRVFMTYFNTATIRHIISMMKRLIHHYGDKLVIEWAYERGDEEIRDRGQDISEVVKFNFVFEEVKE
ncbi:MAG TPA: DUF1987 domain-containing protein [Bacteroidia bacterium]|jgi:hypothetical protein|nr:DUF1987 domain-containing protein [Bacteroidia bacterium]